MFFLFLMNIKKFKRTKILHIYSNFAHLLEMKFSIQTQKYLVNT